MPPKSEVLEALRQELAATNVLLSGFYDELHASRVETAVRVESLRAEQNRDRRVRLMAVAGGGLVLFYVGQEHVQACSPGARATSVFDASERGVKDVAVLKHLYDHPHNQDICDMTQPFISHSVEAYPTAANGFGLTAIALIACVVAWYHRRRTRRDFGRVADAANMERRQTRR